MTKPTAVNPIADPRRSFTALNGRTDTPRCVVVIKGFAFVPISCEVVNNAHGVLDTATVTLSISGNPDFSDMLKAPDNDADDDGGSTIASVYMGFPAHPTNDTKDYKQLDRVFYGIVDEDNPEFHEDTVTLTMRSIGALLELKKQTNVSLNETTVQFVQNSAKKVGLKCVVDLGGQPMGTLAKVYARDFMVSFHNQRLWKTIIQCAEYDDADAFVDGDTLYYLAVDRQPHTEIKLHWGKDLLRFSGQHSDQFNRNIKVIVKTNRRKERVTHTVRNTVKADGTIKREEATSRTTTEALFGPNGRVSTTRSLNVTTGAVTTSQATSILDPNSGPVSTGAVTLPRDSSAEVITLYEPGLTPNEANALAEKRTRQITRNEYAATMTIIPSADQFKHLVINAKIGTYDLPYRMWNYSAKFPFFWPRRITKTFSMPQDGSTDGGLVVVVEAVNHRLPRTSGGG